MNLAQTSSYFYGTVVELQRQCPTKLDELIAEYIDCVEDELLKQPQIHVPIFEHLEDGLYIRTMHCPAGTALTGAWHRKSGVVLLQSGDISVLTQESCTRSKGPVMFPCPAGVRRLGYCHTDVIWSNIFSVESTSLDKIWDELFAFTEEEL